MSEKLKGRRYANIAVLYFLVRGVVFDVVRSSYVVRSSRAANTSEARRQARGMPGRSLTQRSQDAKRTWGCEIFCFGIRFRIFCLVFPLTLRVLSVAGVRIGREGLTQRVSGGAKSEASERVRCADSGPGDPHHHLTAPPCGGVFQSVKLATLRMSKEIRQVSSENCCRRYCNRVENGLNSDWFTGKSYFFDGLSDRSMPP